MSKNIFSVLAKEESDDDKSKSKSQANQQPARLPKKEARVLDKQLRETFGDQVQKDTVSHKRLDNPPKDKGDYGPGEKRPFERHSGTGQPAFGNNFKKGGHGKGNVGAPLEEAVKEKDNAEGLEEEQPPSKEQNTPQEPEQIITADQYLEKTGLRYNFLNPEEPIKNSGQPIITDPNVKVMHQKPKDEGAQNKKGKNLDGFIQGSKSLIPDESGAKINLKAKNQPQQQKNNIEYNEQNFPSLS